MLVAPLKISDALRKGSGHMLFHSPSGGVSRGLGLQETNENIKYCPLAHPQKNDQRAIKHYSVEKNPLNMLHEDFHTDVHEHSSSSANLSLFVE